MKDTSSYMASSPVSSDDAATRNGSPETKLTAFSPEDIRFKSRLEIDSGFGSHKYYPIFTRRTSMGQCMDPFLVAPPPSSTGTAQLSPTASSFIPKGLLGENPFGPIGPPSRVTDASFPTASTNYRVATVEPETAKHGDALDSYETKFAGFTGPTKIIKTPAPILYVNFGQFDEVNHNRAFAIEGVPADMAYPTIAGLFDRQEYATIKGLVLTELSSSGLVYVGFTDMREAENAKAKVARLHPAWRMHMLTAKEFAHKLEETNATATSDFEGQVLATVGYNGFNPGIDGRAVSHAFKRILDTFGDIRVFHCLPTGQGTVVAFHIEFFDTNVAENVVIALNGASVDGLLIDVKLHQPDVFQAHPVQPVAKFNELATPARPHVRRLTASSPLDSPRLELSITGRSTVPVGERDTLMPWSPRFDDGFGSRQRPERYLDARSNSQNYVDIERIRCGLDVRTTIMLRNIPNKIDQAMLKEIVDETSHGKYDFMYLRIDFGNNCNVGYAFINFEDFAKARAGRTWNCFNSDKVAEISYATIQGKDCLVQKFRNSSVMLEHPSFRPKIFHTGNGPLAGTEDRFPGPDNPSKMRRSVENAEHVGLFAPRVGQQYRDEQRRRRSQYDRGTTAAERETHWNRNFTPRRAAHNSNNGGGYMSPMNGHWYDTPRSR
ncbi:hypothetical protein AJ80_00483 [Polytolypa hystricis UAMH7299]|uniref:RRM domain-containing protein n=1 Tax=Polytolypa hystricis (strain UAMH7299) TaxID=1447883 RepID=A0A2B7Z3X0_POLH7|nr:hypothetical protein AJ80_00483 [Polytolypa hystricis UAMH7299]